MVLLKLSRDSLMPFNATAPVTIVHCFLLLDISDALSADRLRLEEVNVEVVVWEMDAEEFRDWESRLGIATSGWSDESGEIGDESGYADELEDGGIPVGLSGSP